VAEFSKAQGGRRMGPEKHPPIWYLFGNKELMEGYNWDGIWKKIIEQKYIKPRSIIDWIRNPRKNIKNVSNQWKALVMAFPVIG
jgi:hypothetical protein